MTLLCGSLGFLFVAFNPHVFHKSKLFFVFCFINILRFTPQSYNYIEHVKSLAATGLKKANNPKKKVRGT